MGLPFSYNTLPDNYSVDLGSVRGQFGIVLGPISGKSEVILGVILGRFGVRLEFWGRFGKQSVELCQDRCHQERWPHMCVNKYVYIYIYIHINVHL